MTNLFNAIEYALIEIIRQTGYENMKQEKMEGGGGKEVGMYRYVR